MKKITLIIFIGLHFILVSCQNKNHKKYILKLIKSADIKFLNEEYDLSNPSDFIVNKDEIFILDRDNYRITKFDSNGNFLLSFGGKGQGPGEFINPSSLLDMQDSLCVMEWSNNNLSFFSKEGIFLHRKHNKSGSFRNLVYFSNILLGHKFNFSRINNKIFMTNNIGILDKNFKKFTPLFELKKEYDKNNSKIGVFDLYTPFCKNKNKIFIAENSTNSFKIHVLDINGTTINKIERNYVKEKYSDEEFKSLKETNAENYENHEYNNKFRYAVQDLFWDSKYDFLWVGTGKSEKEKYNFELYKASKFVGNLKLELPLGSFFLNSSILKFSNAKIYFLNYEKNCLSIYNYEIKEEIDND